MKKNLPPAKLSQSQTISLIKKKTSNPEGKSRKFKEKSRILKEEDLEVTRCVRKHDEKHFLLKFYWCSMEKLAGNLSASIAKPKVRQLIAHFWSFSQKTKSNKKKLWTNLPQERRF